MAVHQTARNTSPGCGAFNRRPGKGSVKGGTHMVGKPSHWLVNRIVERNGLDRARTCMVGDRLDTDVAFGNNGGVTSVLVLTGCTGVGELNAALAEGSVSGADEATRALSPQVILPFLGKIADAYNDGSKL